MRPVDIIGLVHAQIDLMCHTLYGLEMHANDTLVLAENKAETYEIEKTSDLFHQARQKLGEALDILNLIEK